MGVEGVEGGGSRLTLCSYVPLRFCWGFFFVCFFVFFWFGCLSHMHVFCSLLNLYCNSQKHRQQI